MTRGEPIPEGLFHLACDVIVRHTDGSYLLMQRDTHKPYGGMWEATAGGSSLQGEDPAACAARELREETGIRAEHLREVGRTMSRDTVYVEFLCETDCEKDAVRLQPGETIACQWVSKYGLLAMKKNELVTRRIQRFISDLPA